VIRGSGDVSAGGQSYPIKAGERGEFNGTEDVRYSISSAPGPDNFDRWAQGRDEKEDNSTSARYVSRDTVGYSDLDDNARGTKFQNTDMCGIRTRSKSAGRLIATDTGAPLGRGDGRG